MAKVIWNLHATTNRTGSDDRNGAAGNITGQASIQGNEKALHDVDACWDGADQGIGLQSGSVCFRRRGCVRAVSVARGGRTQR
jgi:hypothetical protein